MLEKAYINEIKCFIQEKNEETKNKNETKNYSIGFITMKDIEEIAEKMIEDDYLNELLNNTINEYLCEKLKK